MGKTLWERWTEKPTEYKFFDPLRVKIGGFVTLDILDYRDFPFSVKEIREYKRPELGADNTFTDYVLLARPLGQDDKWVRIRCFKVNSKDGMPFQPVLLEQYDSLVYDKGLHDVVRDTTGVFQVNDGGRLVAEYYRPKAGGKAVLSSYKAEVRVIEKLLGEGVADDGLPGQPNIVKSDVEYWDYSRTTKDEAGQDVEEYLFVEMDDADAGDGFRKRWFTIWKGFELDPHRVVLM